MNTYAIGLGIGAFVAVVGIVGYKGEQYGEALVREQWNEERREWERQSAALREQRQNGIDNAGQFKEDSRNGSRVIYRTITKAVPTYIDRPVYGQPCMDDSGLRSVNAALTGQLPAESAAKPDATVPAIDAAGGRNGR